MFTGIIEEFGKIIKLKSDRENLHIILESNLTKELKVDQSLAHNGVCLTVVNIRENQYQVTAVQETLQKSNLGTLKLGDFMNLERAMKMNGRLDGHIVQGHVDQIGNVRGLRIKVEVGCLNLNMTQIKETLPLKKDLLLLMGLVLLL